MQKTNSITRRSFVATTVSAAALSALPVQAEEASATTTATRGAEQISLTPYLLFNGNCREAMEFYKQCLGGELELTKVKDSGAKDHLPAFQQEKVLNAKLRSGVLEIAASDWLRPQETPMRGNTVCMYLSGSEETVKRLFARLSDGADVTDPLTKQFFGLYGALNDRFGVRWMFLSNN